MVPGAPKIEPKIPPKTLPEGAPGAETTKTTIWIPFGNLLGGSRRTLGSLLAALGAVLGPLGSLLAPPGPLLRLIVASRGPSWKLFGALVEAPLENDENLENHCFFPTS